MHLPNSPVAEKVSGYLSAGCASIPAQAGPNNRPSPIAPASKGRDMTEVAEHTAFILLQNNVSRGDCFQDIARDDGTHEPHTLFTGHKKIKSTGYAEQSNG